MKKRGIFVVIGVIVCALFELITFATPAYAFTQTISGSAVPATGSTQIDDPWPLCHELEQDVKATAGGTTSGPFAEMYSESNCLNTTAGTKPTSVNVCNDLTTLASYAMLDSQNTSGKNTATGLSPSSAGLLGTKIMAVETVLGCPRPQSNQGTTADIKRAIDGLEWWALFICIAVIFISCILWALGSKGQNPGQELTGKRGIIVSLTAACLIGTLPGFMNWLDLQGKRADSVGVLTSGFPSSSSTGGCTLGNQGSGSCGGASAGS